jgi:hypothetical protein
MALILSLSMLEGDGTPVYQDSTANNNDATLSVGNTEDYDTTGPGGSLTVAANGTAMNGVTGLSLAAPIVFAANAAFTACFFAKRDATNRLDSLFWDTNTTNTVAFANGANSLIAYEDGGTEIGTKATGVTTTDWHHYALVGDTDGSLVLWVDGVSVGSVGTRLGGNFDVSFLLPDFNGKLDGLTFYDTTRTAGQINTDANVGGLGTVGGGSGGTRGRLLYGGLINGGLIN